MTKKREEAITKLLEVWLNTFGAEGASTAVALRAARRFPELKDAMDALVTSGNAGVSLGQMFRQIRAKGEPIGGMYIMSDVVVGNGNAVWRVIKPAVVMNFLPGDEAADAVVEKRMKKSAGCAPVAEEAKTSETASEVTSSLKELPVSLTDLRNACLADNRTWHLDLSTGKIEASPTPSSVIIPPPGKQVRYAWLHEFIETFKDPDTKAFFKRAIDGENAFRRFRQASVQYGKVPAWHDFQTNRLNLYIDNWLSMHGIKRASTEAVPAETPSSEVEVLLFKGLQAKIINSIQAHQLLELAKAIDQ